MSPNTLIRPRRNTRKRPLRVAIHAASFLLSPATAVANIEVIPNPTFQAISVTLNPAAADTGTIVEVVVGLNAATPTVLDVLLVVRRVDLAAWPFFFAATAPPGSSEATTTFTLEGPGEFEVEAHSGGATATAPLNGPV